MPQASKPAGPERRTFARVPYRIPCSFEHQGAKLGGIVTDVAARGVFVETSHRIPPGTELRLVLLDPRGAYDLTGRVVREKRSHRSARQVLSGGFSVTLDVIPEPFFQLLVQLGLG
jgi:hypothetical protein